ncbi:carbonic anhydrase [Rhizobium altiplani]|uniref:carbonic anhydrase n=1 Tax=Rhizobium altiplani TaxID=1864509 RepID=A0A109JY56_9HYPH|nr:MULTISPECIES: carbonic anhydrase [Rhizobium]KWV57282.1 carbonic anhydrase [Rhizobium altiplani]KWV57287.1 carbonic anhydrase [Rhizobium altiplani]KWV57484.1 carbonic anhydrase [Rhizobium altiplani]
MCFDCNSSSLSRRSLLKFAGIGGVAAMTACFGRTMPAFASNAPALLPDEALAKLQEGNKKFVADAEACAANISKRRQDVAKSQAPWAIVLTCSDSRVVPELVFGGVTLGELFVARNAGNVVDTDVLGTIEYGTEHLHAPLIVVMGHKRCGAVSAACEVVSKGTKLDGSIGKMIQPILPVALAETDRGDNFVDKTVHANAFNGAERILTESAIVSRLVEEGKVKIVPAYYDLDTGVVDFLHKV